MRQTTGNAVFILIAAQRHKEICRPVQRCIVYARRIENGVERFKTGTLVEHAVEVIHAARIKA